MVSVTLNLKPWLYIVVVRSVSMRISPRMEITMPTHMPEAMIAAITVNMKGAKLSLVSTVGTGGVKYKTVATGRICIL